MMLSTKKRTLVLSLLAIVMAISVAFGVNSFTTRFSAYASDEHVHCFCGNVSCSKDLHDDTLIWEEWDGKTNITNAGNYYLADSVEADEITNDIVVSADVNLCLNGKALNLSANCLNVAQGATLNISDCVGGGVITSSRTYDSRVKPVVGTIEVSGKLNVYGGTLTHFRDAYISERYSAINVAATGELNVFGGTITGEDSVSINNLGKVVIDGGTLTSGIYNGFTYTQQSSLTVQTVVNPATITIKSGEINSSNAIVNAGTISVEGGSINAPTGNAVKLNFAGVLNVSGGTISSEKSTCVIMSAVTSYNSSIQATGTITVSGGTVTTSAYQASYQNCFAILGRNLHVSGGTISNTSQEGMYAISLVGNIYLSGVPTILAMNGHEQVHYGGSDIYANDGKSNPTYYEGETIKMSNTTSIQSKVYQTVVYGLKDEAQAQKFILEEYQRNRLIYENNQLILVPEHAHCIGACTGCADATHKIDPDNGYEYNYIHIRNNEINFTKTDYEYNLPYEDYFNGGNFENFLVCDINTTNEKNRISGTSILCLNGYDVDGHNIETVSGQGILAITDCKGEGSIKGITIADGGTLRVYSGRVGEITVENGAKLFLFGGIYAQKFENATIPAGFGWVANNDSATKTQYPYKITATKTISFNANGGVGEMDNQVVEAGVQSTLNGNMFTKQGYEFGGWAISADGEKVFDNLQSITTSNDITLYAIWNARTNTPYVVQHYFENLAGEYILDGTKTQNLFGTTASTITAMHLTDIVGFEANLDHAESFVSSTVLSDGSLVLKLYYARTTHTVTVAINNSAYGTVDKPVIQNVKYGTQITVNANIVMVGDQTITVTAAAQTDTNSFYFVNITGGNITVSGDQTLNANFITHLRVDKPNADTTNFIYDGTEKTYNIPADAIYNVVGNKQTEIGIYQVVVSLADKDASEWKDGTNTDLVYEFIINAGQQSFVDENNPDNSKPSVVVSSPTGIAPDISLVVVDKTTDAAVIAKLPTEKKFAVQKIYDISLERNGGNVQVSEVGGLITIKILISEELKADNIKLYHIHGDEQGVEIVRGSVGVVNQYVIDGDYAIITIDRLSEFAFVEEQTDDFLWVWIAGVAVIVVLIMAVLIINIKKNGAKNLTEAQGIEEVETKKKD